MIRQLFILITLTLVIHYFSSPCQQDLPISFMNLPDTISSSSPLKIGFSEHYNDPYLILENSIGITQVNSINKQIILQGQNLRYAGMTHFIFLNHNEIIHDKWVYIRSSSPKPLLETYQSFRNIKVGGADVSQTISFPLDKYNNLLDHSESLQVNINHDQITNEKLTNWYKNYSAYIFHSSNHTGEVPFSIYNSQSRSSLLTVIMESDQPAYCKLSYSRKSPYADGKQIIRFEAFQIEDQFHNKIKQGNYLQLEIKNNQGISTISNSAVTNDRAIFEVNAPAKIENWEAYIKYKDKLLCTPLKITFDKSNIHSQIKIKENKITIENISLESKMIIPDGINVQLYIYKNNFQIKLNSQTENGEASFDYKKEIIPKGTYQYVCNILGETIEGVLEIE